MSYYTGQGDYYSGKGDPGLFGSIFGAIKGAATGLFSGGPLGAITGGVRGAITGGRTAAAPARATVPMRLPPISSVARGGAQLPTPGILGMAQRAIPGGATGYEGCAPGYHIHKTEGDRCVKNRRMNVANPKALRRSIRRQAGFVALAKETLRGSGYTFKRTGAPTKRRRRRRH